MIGVAQILDNRVMKLRLIWEFLEANGTNMISLIFDPSVL